MHLFFATDHGIQLVAGTHSVEFAEEWGQILNLTVFFLFGILVIREWSQFTLILDLRRTEPDGGSHAAGRARLDRHRSKQAMGWFGPRGLASIVLGMVYLEQELHLPG